MKLSLKPDVNEFVRRKLESGEYADPSDVVDEALRHWMNDESPEFVAYVRAAIAEGDEAIRKGKVAPFDRHEILAEAHKEHKERMNGKRSSVRSR